MSDEGLIDFGIRLGESARRRFVHWDGALWDDFLTGPLNRLAEGLSATSLTHQQATALARSYLELACEAVGLGYLYPTSTGRANVFTHLWRELLPRDLPRMPAQQQAAALAACWNLGENLENAPVWLQRVLLRSCQSLPHLEQLEAMVESVSRRVLETPSTPLGKRPRAFWVYLPREDARFLPGWAHFVAPTIACVHDRLRTSASGGREVTCGVLIDEEPMLLGPLDCEARSPAPPPQSKASLSRYSLRDPRVSPCYHLEDNGWRGAASLFTSQYLVVLCP